ncbi:MAG: hypothetical protein A2Z02_04535 [Chloroflexi bacterium RBG_16_48_7]|nr:MAG: hypothetical protein A2Z02_04535 [Chloroflexi bacterium RBG_16_48_7]
MKVHLILAALVLSVLAFSSCVTINTGPGSTTEPATTAPSIPFEDRTWVLEKIGPKNAPLTAFAGKEVSARFDTASGKVSGYAGCNTYGATYQKNSDKLTVSTYISTKMLCSPNEAMQQEMQYASALQGAQSYRAESNSLTIFSSEDRILVFRAK